MFNANYQIETSFRGVMNMYYAQYRPLSAACGWLMGPNSSQPCNSSTVYAQCSLKWPHVIKGGRLSTELQLQGATRTSDGQAGRQSVSRWQEENVCQCERAITMPTSWWQLRGGNVLVALLGSPRSERRGRSPLVSWPGERASR